MSEKKIRMATSEDPQDQGHTIVGGRPAAAKSQRTDIPRGLELLIKRAAIDSEFRITLLEKREKLIEELQIPLDESEKAMLACVPAEHLEKMIAATEVPTSQKRALRTGSVAAMVALMTGLAFAPVAGGTNQTQPVRLTKSSSSDSSDQYTMRLTGIRPDDEPVIEKDRIGIKTGIRPDAPTERLVPVGSIPETPAPELKPIIKPRPVINDYDDHLADRGARPDFPEDLEPVEPIEPIGPSTAHELDDTIRQSGGDPDIHIDYNVSGLTFSEALKKLSKSGDLEISFTGLDDNSINYPIQTEVENMPLAQAIQTICIEVQGIEYDCSFITTTDSRNIQIKFMPNPALPGNRPPKQFNLNDTNDDSSSFVRGIRSDFPGQQIDFDDGDNK